MKDTDQSSFEFVNEIYDDSDSFNHLLFKVIYMLYFLQEEEFTKKEVQEVCYLLYEIGERVTREYTPK